MRFHVHRIYLYISAKRDWRLAQLFYDAEDDVSRGYRVGSACEIRDSRAADRQLLHLASPFGSVEWRNYWNNYGRAQGNRCRRVVTCVDTTRLLNGV